MNFKNFALFFLLFSPLVYGVEKSAESLLLTQSISKSLLAASKKKKKVRTVSFKNKQAKKIIPGIILQFYTWPDTDEKKSIENHLKKLGLIDKEELKKINMWVFEWPKLKTLIKAELACQSLSGFQSLKLCGPNHSIITNESRTGDLKSCDIVSASFGLQYGKLSDYWAQRMIGSDLIKEELEQADPIEKKELVRTFDNITGKHHILVRNLISDDGEHSVLPELGNKVNISVTPFTSSILRESNRMLENAENVCASDLEDEEDTDEDIDEGSNNEGSNNDDSNNEGSNNEGSNNEGSNNEGSNNEGSNNEGSNNEGSNNEGSNNEGSNNEGSNNEGSNNEGSNNDDSNEGSNNEGSNNEGSNNDDSNNEGSNNESSNNEGSNNDDSNEGSNKDRGNSTANNKVEKVDRNTDNETASPGQKAETLTHGEIDYIRIHGWANNRHFRVSNVISFLSRNNVQIEQVKNPYIAELSEVGRSYSPTVHAIRDTVSNRAKLEKYITEKGTITFNRTLTLVWKPATDWSSNWKSATGDQTPTDQSNPEANYEVDQSKSYFYSREHSYIYRPPVLDMRGASSISTELFNWLPPIMLAPGNKLKIWGTKEVGNGPLTINGVSVTLKEVAGTISDIPSSGRYGRFEAVLSNADYNTILGQ